MKVTFKKSIHYTEERQLNFAINQIESDLRQHLNFKGYDKNNTYIFSLPDVEDSVIDKLVEYYKEAGWKNTEVVIKPKDFPKGLSFYNKFILK